MLISFSCKHSAHSVSRAREALPLGPLPRSHLLVELHQALLADVVGPHDDQRIKGRDGKSEEITQRDKNGAEKRETGNVLVLQPRRHHPTQTEPSSRLENIQMEAGPRLHVSKKNHNKTEKNLLTFRRLSESDSLLPAEAEDAAHVQRLPAEVAAVQAQPQRLEAQFAQR